MGIINFFFGNKQDNNLADKPLPKAVDPRTLSGDKVRHDMETLMAFDKKIKAGKKTLSEDITQNQNSKSLSLANPFRGV